ncbi:MAG: D-lyxose/D-mannose family sugar isomerase, partial [Calditrichae bacterium]|nr:D-lyxose/D-mannose family sugar isomerase [Calditrichia bacterium]
MKLSQVKKLQEKTAEFLQNAHIVITNEERENIEIADFGLDDISNIGLQIVIYENNERYCAK